VKPSPRLRWERGLPTRPPHRSLVSLKLGTSSHGCSLPRSTPAARFLIFRFRISHRPSIDRGDILVMNGANYKVVDLDAEQEGGKWKPA